MTSANDLERVATAFVDTAHRIVWATVATVDRHNRPRTRVLHPLWRLDGGVLSGVIASGPTAAKSADLAHSPYMSIQYWDDSQDVCRADCHVAWEHDVDARVEVWDAFKHAPAPVGYDPAMIPPWAEGGPRGAAFGVLRLRPYLLRVFPGSLLVTGQGEVLTWHEPDERRRPAALDYVELPATDLAATKAFYTEVFGCDWIDYGPTYAASASGSVELALNTLATPAPTHDAGAENGIGPLLLLSTADLEAVEAAVRAAGGTIISPIYPYPGGRRFHLVDPSGNTLGIYQSGS